jgi:cytoskeletal protein RodZ
MGLKKSERVTAAIGLAGVCVVAVAMVMAARQPSQPVDVAALNFEAQPEMAAAVEPTAEKPPVARAQAKKMAAAKAPAAADAPPARTLSADASVATESAAPARAAESTVTVSVQESADVTIEGCLERDAETFRLKDTSGEGAPKSRSWKSGFLRKGAARIEVIDAENRLKLPNHVGQRISVTGVLVDREMRAYSLELGGASCK